MRALIACACLSLAGCGKKGEDKDKPVEPPPQTADPANADPVPKPADPAAGSQTAPPPIPSPTPAPPPAPAATVDCAALVTPEDVAAACGVSANDVTVERIAMETGKGATTCLRSVKIKGAPAFKLAVNTAPKSADAAKRLLDLDRTAGPTKDVPVGDSGLLAVRSVGATKSTNHEIEAVKGAVWFKLLADVKDGAKAPPPCGDDGLVAVGKAVASHLP